MKTQGKEKRVKEFFVYLPKIFSRVLMAKLCMSCLDDDDEDELTTKIM